MRVPRWRAGACRKLRRLIRVLLVRPLLLYIHVDTNTISLGWGTQLALAYAIHKSFIFIRVPLTIALTPRLVKLLRGWGWDIGKRTTKEAKAVKRAALPPKKKRKWRKNRGGDDKKA